MLTMLIMMEPHLGLACGKVNIISIKNIILMHVIIFVTKLSCSYVYVCLFSFIIACFLPKEAPIAALQKAAPMVLFVLRTFSLTSCCML
jgi:hypothetical protein